MKKVLLLLLSLILISNVYAQQGKGMLGHIEAVKDNTSFGDRPLKGKTYTYKVNITGGSTTVELECENGSFDNGKTYKIYHDTHSFTIKITWSETASSGKIKATTPSNHLYTEYGVNIEDVKVNINGPDKIKYGETATYRVAANPNISVTSTNWTAGSGLIIDGSHTQGEFKVRAQNNVPLNTNVRITASTNFGSLANQKNISVEPVLSMTSNRNPACLNENVTFTVIGVPTTGATIKWRPEGLVSGQGTPSAIYKMGSYPNYFSIAPEVILSGKSYYPEIMIWAGPPKPIQAEKEYSIGFTREPVQLIAEFTGDYTKGNCRWEIISGQGEFSTGNDEMIWVRSTASLDFSDIVVKSTVRNRCGEASMLHRIHVTPIREPLRLTPEITSACVGGNLEFRLTGENLGANIEWSASPTNIIRLVSGQGTTTARYICNANGKGTVQAKVTYWNSYYQKNEEVILTQEINIGPPVVNDQTLTIGPGETLTINAPVNHYSNNWQVIEGYCDFIERSTNRIIIKIDHANPVKIKGTFYNGCGSSSAIYTINPSSPYKIEGPSYIQYGHEAQYSLTGGSVAGKRILWNGFLTPNLEVITGDGTANVTFRAIENDEIENDGSIVARVFYGSGENDFISVMKHSIKLGWEAPPAVGIIGPDNVCNNSEAEYTISGPFAGKAIHWFERDDFILVSGQGTPTAKFRANYVPYLDPQFPISVRIGNNESEYQYFIKWISLDPCTSKSLSEPDKADNTFTATLYPNPTNGYFSVELPDDLGESPKGKYTISNISGGVIKSGNINASRFDLDISGAPAGTYLLNMNINNKTTTLRIIKK